MDGACKVDSDRWLFGFVTGQNHAVTINRMHFPAGCGIVGREMGNNVGNGIKMVGIHVADNAVMTGDERMTIGNDELITFEATLFAKSPTQ